MEGYDGNDMGTGMKAGLQIGAVYQFETLVRESDEASLMGQPVHPGFYGTSAMIAHMEWVARQHILPYLEAGEEGVGIEVGVRHLAPTLVGESVRLQATVTRLDARQIECFVEAWNPRGKIGEGRVIQAFVQQEKFYRLLEQANTNFPKEKGGLSKAGVVNLEATHSATQRAALLGVDGQKCFEIGIVGWDAGMPCTRYDEWLVCELKLQAGVETLNAAEPVVHQGAFMLRYELEELAESAVLLSAGTLTTYESDYLEPILSITMGTASQKDGLQEASVASEFCRCAFRLCRPKAGAPAVLEMSVTPEGLKAFSEDLKGLLSRFPSRL